MNKKSIFSSIQLILFACCLFLLPALVQSQAEAVTLTVGNDSAPSGSQGNQIAVTLNNDVPIKAVQLEICDEDNFISSTGCEGVDRASGFMCALQESPDGCCRII